MRFLILILVLSTSTSYAQKSEIDIFSAGSGEWENADNWSLKRVPGPGDIIIIPISSLVVISQSFTLEKIDLVNAGQLLLNGCGIEFDEHSRITVAESGSIESKGKSKEEVIIIGKLVKFNGETNETIHGYAFADLKTKESPNGFSTDNYRSPDIYFQSSEQKKENDWSNGDNWSLARVPAEGDKIIVPENIQLHITEPQKFEDVSFSISGELVLDNAGLILGKASSITVEKNGILSSANSDKSESILINEDLKFDGSTGKSIEGYAFADINTGVSPNGFSSDASLPVKLGSFTAIKLNGNVLLEWVAESDINFAFFQVQQSMDGRVWQTIGTVNANFNSVSFVKYEFTVKLNIQHNAVYFRLSQVDKDNKNEYSKVIVMNISQKDLYTPSISLLSGNSIAVRIDGDVPNALNVRIMDVEGRVLYKEKIRSGTTIINYKSLSNRQKQFNVLQLTDGNGYFFAKGFVTK
ncbi:MAG: hypothetical protein ABI415_01490 [Flavitalea sp.]